jgi:hypothetical protein
MVLQNNLFWPPQPAEVEEAPSMQIGGDARSRPAHLTTLCSDSRFTCPALREASGRAGRAAADWIGKRRFQRTALSAA